VDSLVEVVGVDVADKTDRDILNKALKGGLPADVVNNVIISHLSKRRKRVRKPGSKISEKHSKKRERAKKRNIKATKKSVSKKKASKKKASKQKASTRTPS